MERLIEFATNHPLLATGVVATFLAALAHAYRRDHFRRSRAIWGEFRQRLNMEIDRERETQPSYFQLGQRGPRRDDYFPGDLNDLEI